MDRPAPEQDTAPAPTVAMGVPVQEPLQNAPTPAILLANTAGPPASNQGSAALLQSADDVNESTPPDFDLGS